MCPSFWASAARAGEAFPDWTVEEPITLKEALHPASAKELKTFPAPTHQGCELLGETGASPTIPGGGSVASGRPQ